MKKLKRIAAIIAAAIMSAAFASAADVNHGILAQAHSALQAGEVNRALSLLQDAPRSGPEAADALNLQCRARYSLEQWNEAASACAEAVRIDGQNSDYHLWLGRALGEKASRASFLTAYSLAKQARAEFETSVRLDPRNAEALADLGEFYAEAPVVVGGGLDKAESTAEKLDKVDRSQAAELRGRIAQARKDYAGAERHFKEAVTLSARPAEAWASLASFYRQQKQWEKMEWAVRNCAAAATRGHDHGVGLFNGASVLIQANRDSELAARMLDDYLRGPRTESGPAFQAHLWLARLKQQLGDAEGAQQEQAAARTLVGEMLPPRSAKN